MDLDKTLIKARELSQKNWLHAVHLLNSIEDDHPNDFRVQTSLADIYYSRMQFSHALKYYLKALSVDPGNTKIIYAIGTCYLSRRDYRLALAYLKRIPDPSEDVLYNIGYAQALLGMHAQCIKTMLELIKRLPHHPYLYSILIEQYFELGELDEALFYVKQAEKNAGDSFQTQSLAGLIYATREQWLPAYYYYRKAEDNGVLNNPEHLLRYANAARMVGRAQECIRILRYGESKWPYINDIHVMLIRTLIQERKFDEAKAAAEKAKRDVQNAPPVLRLLLERLKDL